jgi:hypothetical protein
MHNRDTHTGKTKVEKSLYYAKKIRSPQNEIETFKEAYYDRTDAPPPTEEEVSSTKPEGKRPRETKFIVKEGTRKYWYIPIIIMILIWFYTFVSSINKDIGKLEARTEDLPFMKNLIIGIDKNVEIMKTKSEMNKEMLDYRFKTLEDKLKYLEKKN